MRKKLFIYVVYSLFKYPDCMILPKWAIVLQSILFPFYALGCCLNRHNGFEWKTMSWKINGVRIDKRCTLDFEEGQRFKIIRDDFGNKVLKTAN